MNSFDQLVQNNLCRYLKKEKIRTNNTFGTHFVLRANRGKNGKAAIYLRIVINKSRCEIALKRLVDISDWNPVKGLAFDKKKNLSANLLGKKKNLEDQFNQKKLASETEYQNYVKQLSDNLRLELSKEIPKCPSQLKEFFLNGNQQELSKRKNLFLQELESLSKRLETDLTKISSKGSMNKYIELANEL